MATSQPVGRLEDQPGKRMVVLVARQFLVLVYLRGLTAGCSLVGTPLGRYLCPDEFVRALAKQDLQSSIVLLQAL